MSDGLTVAGMPYLSGKTVSAFIAGLDCGDYTVDFDGRIFVPWGSGNAPTLTPGFLNSISLQGNFGDLECQIDVTGTSFSFTAYVPVVIGLNYISTGAGTRPMTEQDLRGLKTPGWGTTRRTHQMGMLLKGQQLTVGTTFANQFPAELTDSSGLPLTAQYIFDGVLWQPIGDGYSFDSEVTWVASRPYPCTVKAFTGFLEASER